MSATSRDRTAPAAPAALPLAALLLVATTTLAGCSGGDDADARPQPTAASSTGGSESGSPSASASSGAGVRPATGKLVETSYFTARAPEHYQVDVMGKDFSIAISGAADIGIGIIPESGAEPTLAQLARRERSRVGALRKAPLGRTTTMDGEPAYLLVASEPYRVTSEAGLYHDGRFVHLTVNSYDTRAQNLRLLESILATWQWK